MEGTEHSLEEHATTKSSCQDEKALHKLHRVWRKRARSGQRLYAGLIREPYSIADAVQREVLLQGESRQVREGFVYMVGWLVSFRYTFT